MNYGRKETKNNNKILPLISKIWIDTPGGTGFMDDSLMTSQLFICLSIFWA